MLSEKDLKMDAKEQSKKSVEEASPITAKQVMCIVVVGALNLLDGMLNGWSAILPKVQEDPRFTVTEDDVAWLSSLYYITGIIISPVAGAMAEHVGPRRLILITMFPVAGFWLLQAFIPYLWGLYLGRALLSSSATVLGTLLQPFVAEMCPTRIRGVASALPELFSCVGLLISYLLASQLSWVTATAFSAAPFLPLACLMLLVPESPYWLVRKERFDEAEKSLRLLLAREDDVTQELDAIMRTTAPKQSQLKGQLRELRKQHNLLPVLLILSVFVLRELGGKGPVFNYTVYMFRRAGVQLDPFYCTVFVGVARLVSTCVSACALELLGRRPLLVVTAAVCSVSLSVAGTFLFLEVEGASWVPLAAVMVFVVGYGTGLGPIPWIYLGELLPTPVRSLGSTIIVFYYSITYFFVNLLFLKAISSLGVGLTFLTFGFANMIIVLLVALFIPETKGKTLQDLELAFKKKGVASSNIKVAVSHKKTPAADFV